MRLLSMSFLLKVVLAISPCPPWLVPMAYGLWPMPMPMPMAYGLWPNALRGWCLWPMAYAYAYAYGLWPYGLWPKLS